MKLPVLLLLLTLAVGAAAGAAGAGAGAPEPQIPPDSIGEPPNPTDPRIADGSAAKALNRARAKWKRAKLRSYDMEARRSCFCPTTGWHKVKVRDNQTRRPHSDVEEIATVPRLFRVIRLAIKAKAHRLTVSYGRYGVPKKISIDRVENVIDEEQYFSIRRFKRR